MWLLPTSDGKYIQNGKKQGLVKLYAHRQSLLHSASMARRRNRARWEAPRGFSTLLLRQSLMAACRYSKREEAVELSVPPLAHLWWWSSITQSRAWMQNKQDHLRKYLSLLSVASYTSLHHLCFLLVHKIKEKRLIWKPCHMLWYEEDES